MDRKKLLHFSNRFDPTLYSVHRGGARTQQCRIQIGTKERGPGALHAQRKFEDYVIIIIESRFEPYDLFRFRLIASITLTEKQLFACTSYPIIYNVRTCRNTRSCRYTTRGMFCEKSTREHDLNRYSPGA